ncbi:MAG: nucleotidyltransferase [Clostridiales bacterium]|nr:nucleotidyltransferase [Clostridiales bacterium]
MRATGITAEYNPLHNGHVHHLEQARAVTGADAVVVAMSGDCVQRGEPAIMDKWIRTELALKSGADLVIEIPALFCLGNAGQYAEAGVRLLESTGKISHIAFGSESGNAEELIRIASFLKDRHDEIEKRAKELRGTGMSYPAARAAAFSEVRAAVKRTEASSDEEIGNELLALQSPNNILGIEYIKSMRSAKPVVIRRSGAGHHDPYDDNIRFQSASAIRKQVLNGQDVEACVPDHTAKALREAHLTGPDLDKWFDSLRYAVLSTDADVIEDCPSGGEGLANLMKSAVSGADCWSEFIEQIKSKRYTYTRLSRLCMQLLLGITRSRYIITEPGYIRVLGFTEKGRELLAEMRDDGSASLPVIINVNKSRDGLSQEEKALLDLDMRAADVYNLMTGKDMVSGSDHRRGPVIIR